MVQIQGPKALRGLHVAHMAGELFPPKLNSADIEVRKGVTYGVFGAKLEL